MTPFLVIGCFDVLARVDRWRVDLRRALHGSLLLVATGTVFYVLSTLGIGLLISTVSRTQQQAFLAGFLLPCRHPAFWRDDPDSRHAPLAAGRDLLQPGSLLHRVAARVLLKGAGLVDIWWAPSRPARLRPSPADHRQFEVQEEGGVVSRRRDEQQAGFWQVRVISPPASELAQRYSVRCERSSRLSGSDA